MHLIWLRNDLRLDDNTALHAACERGPTLALWLVTPGQWQAHDEADCKVDFWLRNLKALRERLDAVNIPLLIRRIETWDQAPDTVLTLCREHQVETVHWNDEYGVNEEARDAAVRAALEEAGIGAHNYLDQLLFKPGSVLTRSGHYFQVFGQFRKTCMERLLDSLPALVPTVRKQAPLSIHSSQLPRHVEGFDTPPESLRTLWPGGEAEAQRRLRRFLDETAEDYDRLRDLPAKQGTSQLSAYLAAGVISVRQCLHAAIGRNRGDLDSGSQGVQTWITELLWREFYKHIMTGYPRVSRHRAFRPHTEALPWRHAPEELKAWQEGRTGFP